MAEQAAKTLGISYVAFQPHVVITHPQALGTCVILRIPEYVRGLKPEQKQNPGEVRWEVVEPDRRLRYRWEADDAVKDDYGVDFCGEVCSGEEVVDFDVTMRNRGDAPNPDGVSLFCLQAGGTYFFQDYEGERTFVRRGGEWCSVADMIDRRWQSHRMCSFAVSGNVDTEDDRVLGLMVKESVAPRLALGIALDRCKSISCNHKLWPSCIHVNPDWTDVAPGGEATVRGKVYYVSGSKDEILARYCRDFGPEGTAGGGA